MTIDSSPHTRMTRSSGRLSRRANSSEVHNSPRRRSTRLSSKGSLSPSNSGSESGGGGGGGAGHRRVAIDGLPVDGTARYRSNRAVTPVATAAGATNGHASPMPNGMPLSDGHGESGSPTKKGRRVARKAKKPASAPAQQKSWEIPRKIFHSSIGFVVFYLYITKAPLLHIQVVLIVVLLCVASADLLRLNHRGFERVYEKVLGFLMRESEKTKTNGVVYYLIGCVTALYLFPRDIASVSIMILSWCDTSASVFGRLFGRHTPALPSPPFAARKSLAGTLAAMSMGALTAYFFWGTKVGPIGELAGDLSWASSGGIKAGLSRFDTGAGWSDAATLGSEAIGVAAGALPDGTSRWVLARVLGSLSLGGRISAMAESPRIPLPLPILSIATGVVAGVAEALDVGGADDNLTLPILTAVGVRGFLWAWGRGWAWWHGLA